MGSNVIMDVRELGNVSKVALGITVKYNLTPRYQDKKLDTLELCMRRRVPLTFRNHGRVEMWLSQDIECKGSFIKLMSSSTRVQKENFRKKLRSSPDNAITTLHSSVSKLDISLKAL